MRGAIDRTMGGQRSRAVLLGLGAVSLLLLATSRPVHADFVSTFNQSNDAIGTGPWGTLDVTTSGTLARITLTPANNFVFFGNQFLNFDLTQLVPASNISVPSGTAAFNGTPGDNVDAQGRFEYTISFSDGPNSGIGTGASASTYTFTVTGLTAWASDSAVLAVNSAGRDAAGHVSVGLTGSTGFAGEIPGGTVPEPSSLMLFGLGALALGFVMRRSLLPGQD